MSSAFVRLVRSVRLVFIVTILTSTSYTLAAPSGKGNVTLKEFGDSTFASEPHGRGTVGVLLSCTATFIFCIWTAIHPNVVPGIKPSQRVYYKAILMVISILIPEGLIVSAIGEYREARRLQKAWNECEYIPLEFKGEMDLTVAYFVVMGGFIVDEIDIEDSRDSRSSAANPGMLRRTWCCLGRACRYLWRCILCRGEEKPEPKARRQENPYRARLTPTGFRQYMKKGLIDHTSFKKDDILDKGKASAIGKSFAAIQASWLVAQSISRAVAGLPLSLLEIHVLIHLGRTVLIYVLWWSKPLDVNEPIRINLSDGNGNQKPNESASEIPVPSEGPRSFSPAQYDYYSTSKRSKWLKPDEPSIFQINPYTATLPVPVADERAPASAAHEVPRSRSCRRDRRPDPTDNNSVLIRNDFNTKPLHGAFYGEDRLKLEIERSKKYGKEPKFITSRSPRSSNHIIFYKALYDIIIYLDVADREEREEQAAKQEPESDHQPLLDTEHEDIRSPVFSLVMFSEMFLVCLTGALHALAWNKDFPTSIERWLWRSSSLTMCACSLGIFMIANFTQYEQDLIGTLLWFHLDTDSTSGTWKYLQIWIKELLDICAEHAERNSKARKGGEHEERSKQVERLRKIKHMCGVGVTLLLVMIYFFSVSYITIESYFSLRKVPDDMWLTVSWIDYWPHL